MTAHHPITPGDSLANIDVFIEKARELQPLIASYADQNDSNRDVAPEVVDALKKAGLFKLLQPKIWGGHQQDPRTLYAVQNLVAEKCASTAWIVGVLSVQTFILSLMDEKAQADVWGENPDAMLSSSFIPKGKAERTEGGYKLNGQWPFSSGSSHAQWGIVGGVVPSLEEGKPPGMKLFLVPRKDYEIVDTWNTYGLRGTGSNDLLLKDVFVPEYRSFQPSPGLTPTVSTTELEPLYRLPWLYVFTSSVANVSIGIAQAALNNFIGFQGKKISSFTGKPTKDDPAIQLVVARLKAEMDSANSMFSTHIDTLFDHINRECELPMDQAMLIRIQLTSVVRRLAAIVDEMQIMMGGSGIRHDSPLTRIWLDMCGARAHPGNDPAMISAGFGKLLLDQ